LFSITIFQDIFLTDSNTFNTRTEYKHQNAPYNTVVNLYTFQNLLLFQTCTLLAMHTSCDTKSFNSQSIKPQQKNLHPQQNLTASGTRSKFPSQSFFNPFLASYTQVHSSTQYPKSKSCRNLKQIHKIHDTTARFFNDGQLEANIYLL
jgi:hypothetical protein